MMRRFILVREVDVTGVSGTGKVAEGVVFADGTVAIRWLGDTPSTVVWASLDHAMRVHGHNGATVARMIDEDYGTVQHPVSAHIADLDRQHHPNDYGICVCEGGGHVCE
jgi:hypothetical protein